MADFVLGMNGKAYYSASLLTADNSADDLSWTEATNVRSVNLNLSRATADATTRANSGWRANVGTLREMEASFEMVYKDDDAFLTAVKNAYINGTEIAMMFLTGSESTAGEQGPAANFTVTDFSRTEDLEGVIMHSVTLTSSSRQEWYTVSS